MKGSKSIFFQKLSELEIWGGYLNYLGDEPGEVKHYHNHAVLLDLLTLGMCIVLHLTVYV